MTPREVRKARELRADVGLVERRRIDASLLDRLDGDIVRLDEEQRGVAQEFRSTYANWSADEAPAAMRPHALTEDSAIARNYRVAALIALLAEMSVAAWMFWKRDMNPWVGAIFALSITIIFERSIHFAVYGPAGQRRPKVALRTLKRVAFYPALGCFLFAVVTTLIARSVEGPLAADERLVAIVTSGLFFLTLGLVFLAAALSTASFISGWSRRLARRYYAIDRECRMSRAFQAEIRRESLDASDRGVASVDEGGIDQSTQTRSAVTSISRSAPPAAALLLALFLPFATVGCTGQTAEAEAQAVTAVSHDSGSACTAVVDTSGSVANLGMVWTQVRRELPDLVIRRNCAVLRVVTFDVDGWNWKPLVEVEIPPAKHPVVAQIPPELEGAKNFKDALEAKQRSLVAATDAAHRDLVGGLLRQLDSVDEHLKTVSSTCCSDPVGVLRRIALTPKSKDIFVVVTDMADTRLGSRYPALSAASPDVRVLVLLAPANIRDAAHVGAPTGAADQYENRVRVIRTIAPWASVEPYFARGYADLMDSRSTVTGAGQ